MSDPLELTTQLRDFCGRIVEEIEEEITSQEREVLFLFEELDQGASKYSCMGQIAEGGMKKISRVKDSASLRTVAMAELKKEKIDSEKILSFYNEARVTALLEHPNIVPVYEIGHKGDIPYFTMKEIKGETLGSILKKIRSENQEYIDTYNLTVLLNIFLKICDAISYAHSRRIVHLDLKPDNIHVGAFGEVLVIDWGLAKNMDKDPLVKHRQVVSSEIDIENTLDGFVKGTIGYMAPEQARGENHLKNETTDIYSLGAILYSILTQTSPYSKKDIKEAICLMAAGEYTPLDDKSHPAALCAVINKAMAPEQENRYQKVSYLSKEILLYLQGFATKAQEANYSEHAKLFIKRHFLTLSVALSFLVLFCVALAIFILNLQDQKLIANQNANQAIANAKRAIQSEKTAKANELLAQENEKNAVDLYNNLLQATQEKEKLYQVSLPLTLRSYMGSVHEKRYEKSLPILNEVYREDIRDGLYWYYRASALLGELQFDEAIKNLKKADKGEGKKHVDWKIGKLLFFLQKHRRKLGTSQKSLLFLLQHLKPYESNICAHIFTTVYRKVLQTNEEKASFLKQSIELFHPKIEKLYFKYAFTSEGFDIDLSNNDKLNNLCPLSGYPLYKLNLSNCKKMGSFTWIKNTDIQILDLSGIDSKYYRKQIHLSKLKELYLRDMFFRFEWIIGPKLEYIDFTGSIVDILGIKQNRVPKLNFSSCTLTGVYQLSELKGLKHLIIPEERMTNGIIRALKRRKVSYQFSSGN